MKKLPNLLTNNLGLKLLALFFAIGLWLYVLNVEDPEITRSYTVEVTFENEDVLTDADKDYEVLNDSDTVRVSVSAQRSIIEELSASDFNAVVDLDDLTASQMDGTQELEVYVTLNRYSGKTTIISDTRYTTISIEDRLTQSFDITCELTGTMSDGYTSGTVRVMPSSVDVSGVTSLVENVSSAEVTVDVSGMDSSQTLSGELVFYDANGAVVDMSDMTTDYTTVSVYVECDLVKTISLEFAPSGTPASGYRVGEITSSVTEITVQGEEDALADLESLLIDGLDVTDADADVTLEVDPDDYLPYGVSIYDEEIEIEVGIEIVEYDTVTLSIPTENITLSGLSDGYTAEFASETLSVSVSCPADSSDSLTADDLAFTADLSDCTAGTHQVTLSAELPDGVYLSTTVTATIVISAE